MGVPHVTQIQVFKPGSTIPETMLEVTTDLTAFIEIVYIVADTEVYRWICVYLCTYDISISKIQNYFEYLKILNK